MVGRRTKWGVLVLWLALAFVAGPLAGQLASAQQNDIAQWLPGNAEATQVVELQQTFQETDIAPAVVVYERASGITPADEAAAAADATSLADLERVNSEVVGPLPAPDGQALQVIVPIDMGQNGFEEIAGVIDDIRTVTTPEDDGLEVFITGLGAGYADTATAFEGTDAALLLAAVIVVVALLLIIYRSPALWLLPVMSAGIALTTAQAVVYLLAEHAGLTVNGQSAGILTVLVFGASTDYALLLVARYREELRRHADRHDAMAIALRRAAPAIIASAGTVVVGMLCLMFADLNSTRGMGPVLAIGIVVGLLAMTSLLPALLVICGRWLFWPVKPAFGSPEPTATGIWRRLGRSISGRPRTVWVGTALALGVMALGLIQLQPAGLANEDQFVDRPDSVVGQEVLAEHFPAGRGQPVVVIGNATAVPELERELAGTDGIVEVASPTVRDGLVLLEGTLRDQPDSEAAQDTVARVREAVHAVDGADAQVGGRTAMTLDLNRANRHDNQLIIPLVLLAVLVILGLLLRAVVVAVLLVATVVLSFAATLGISALVFEHLFGFNGTDTAFPLLVFVFLVALGVDYNIFLMTRVREESQRHGTRRGVLVGLAVTGGVISSAGLVLAATFAVLATLPLVFFVELGFAVALGVLIETFIVRSVLVSALNLDIGGRIWWPSRLATKPDDAPDRLDPEPEPEPEQHTVRR